ncbi:PREDICTED: alpha/beta hydrolase domain-containing protein 11 isoform X2 [Bison bison bison]|uniref:sn-1-specific diacylglycerol lipase ABHD11 n=1 Tax=Bison bison bison TaxID=43346 RepID=A0A6P3IDN6_BISBB|nr:PREDICTED: alpha/beta hydrolase domain-containing protein 11 isoform X2 [Bison bison bison]
MLRWTRAWTAPYRGIGLSNSSFSRLPIAPSSSQGGTEPRPVRLSYKLLDGEAASPALVFLHGLFGSKTNFNFVAKALAQQTGRRPELVERLIAVDISQVETTSSSNFPNYIAAMRAVDMANEASLSGARKLADERLRSVIQSASIRQLLLTNLVEVDGRFVWRLNLDALAQHLDKILDFPARQETYSGPTLFLRGGNSQFLLPSHYPEIRRLFPRAQMQTVPNAGHLVHSDRPQDFMAAVQSFLA